MSIKNNIFTSMYLCEEFDTKTGSCKGLMNKICTNDNLSASFNVVMQIKYLVKTDVVHHNCFLFLQNDTKVKLMFGFKVPDSYSEEDSEDVNLFGINRVLEFEDYSFPDKGNYLWKLFIIPQEEFIANFPNEEEMDIKKLFDYLDENEYLENMTDLSVE